MKTINATEVKNRFGEFLELSLLEPVTISKTGRPVAVLMSLREYERLSAFEDTYWARRALEAEKEGYLDHKSSMVFIQAKLNEKTLPDE
jgi:prevent-host-death family protein